MANVVLKDKNGNLITYEDVKVVQLNTEEGTVVSYLSEEDFISLPAVTEENNDKILKVVNGEWQLSDDEVGETVEGLPTVTAEDNDKILKVVEGTWQLAEDEKGETTNVTGLPDVTSEDNDKILKVIDGTWQLAEDEVGSGTDSGEEFTGTISWDNVTDKPFGDMSTELIPEDTITLTYGTDDFFGEYYIYSVDMDKPYNVGDTVVITWNDSTYQKTITNANEGNDIDELLDASIEEIGLLLWYQSGNYTIAWIPETVDSSVTTIDVKFGVKSVGEIKQLDPKFIPEHENSWNNITDKPFYEESNVLFEWDGVIPENAVSFTIDGISMYRISDVIAYEDVIVSRGVIVVNGVENTVNVSEVAPTYTSTYEWSVNLYSYCGILLGCMNETTISDVTYPAGIYCNADTGNYVKNITKTVTQQLDPKFIPEHENSWENITDKPFYDTNIVYFTWDGNTTNIETIPNSDGDVACYKLSDTPATKAELLGATLFINYDDGTTGEVVLTEDTLTNLGDTGNLLHVGLGSLVIALEETTWTATNGLSITFPVGMWQAASYNGYFSELKHAGELKQIDEKFIPAKPVSWGNVSDKPFYEETKVLFEWDGDVTGLESVTSSEGELFYKISDTPLTYDELYGATAHADDGVTSIALTEAYLTTVGDNLISVGGDTIISVLNDDSSTGVTITKGLWHVDLETAGMAMTSLTKATTKALDSKYIDNVDWAKISNKPVGTYASGYKFISDTAVAFSDGVYMVQFQFDTDLGTLVEFGKTYTFTVNGDSYAVTATSAEGGQVVIFLYNPVDGESVTVLLYISEKLGFIQCDSTTFFTQYGYNWTISLSLVDEVLVKLDSKYVDAYTKTEIDEMFGTYVTEVAALVGGDA